MGKNKPAKNEPLFMLSVLASLKASVSVLWSVMDSALKTPLGCALSPTLIWQFPIDNRNECTFVTLHNNCMPLILLRSACRHFCKTLVKELALLSYSLSADHILWGHRWNVECCSAFHTISGPQAARAVQRSWMASMLQAVKSFWKRAAVWSISFP